MESGGPSIEPLDVNTASRATSPVTSNSNGPRAHVPPIQNAIPVAVPYIVTTALTQPAYPNGSHHQPQQPYDQPQINGSPSGNCLERKKKKWGGGRGNSISMKGWMHMLVFRCISFFFFLILVNPA